jgi:hypothetical protein
LVFLSFKVRFTLHFFRFIIVNEFYSFISIVKDDGRNGNKGVLTLHGLGGDLVNEDILKLGNILPGDITVGDLFLLMHYSPVLSENPHFLKLLIQWLG